MFVGDRSGLDMLDKKIKMVRAHDGHMVNVAVQTLPNGTKLQALLSTFSKFAKGWCNYVTTGYLGKDSGKTFSDDSLHTTAIDTIPQ